MARWRGVTARARPPSGTGRSPRTVSDRAARRTGRGDRLSRTKPCDLNTSSALWIGWRDTFSRSPTLSCVRRSPGSSVPCRSRPGSRHRPDPPASSASRDSKSRTPNSAQSQRAFRGCQDYGIPYTISRNKKKLHRGNANDRAHPRAPRQGRARRPRPRRQDRRAHAARRRHGRDLHRPAPHAARRWSTPRSRKTSTCIGVSILSGAHMTVFPRILDAARRARRRRHPRRRRRRHPGRGRRRAQRDWASRK